MDVSGHTKLYCVIGDPVEHSLSPLIMNWAFGRSGIDAVYTALRVDTEGLPDAVAGLRALGVQGANVTYPHKEAVLPYIDDPSERVRSIGAANTLRFADSRVWGENTDAAGTAVALTRFAGLSLDGSRVLIFGAGGAARAAALGVLEAGAAAVVFCVRDPSRAGRAVSPLRDLSNGAEIAVLPLHEDGAREMRREAIAASGILINATPVGMAEAGSCPDGTPVGTAEAGSCPDGPHDHASAPDQMGGSEAQPGHAASPLIEDPTWIREGHCCFDFVYGPRETPFLEAARRRGALCLSGVSLLVAQALEAFRWWTGRALDPEEAAKVIERETGARVVARRE